MENRYSVGRKLFACILGLIWGYRTKLAITNGLSISDYLISFIIVMVLLSGLAYMVGKEKKTSNLAIIRKEMRSDTNWAIISCIIGFLAIAVFELIFI